ncbi:MAG: LysR family transcriptional regulator, partial [Proteobacteria bacterium]|nr:LysR family transcriptional regulator [Pseudomonadota bacterium]
LTIARHGTLSAAARALGVTQTTMGRRLEALQGRAGVKLLNRTPGGFVLTTVWTGVQKGPR